ncbi:DUF1669 domain-containing protein [Aequorivita sp. 609]|uniref:phospholipase D-like domain-containing protein n=1 Tax=Aequorivita TaxID=153265 RepID=UPI001610FFE0|nr:MULTISPECIES: phospholipase D-like domain-containing protein [Aequorivita]MBB6682279.1 DUF1669 domain-containing protein [Aequorivita sp. 609]
MTEVYFENIHEEIINEISKAQKSLKICVAWFTDVEIYRTILNVQKKGIKVSIIIANHEFNRNSKVDFKKLLQHNGYVGYIGKLSDGSRDKLMHNKFCIIDNETVITGSYNWTYKARFNDENIIIINNQPQTTSRFINKFESIKPKYGFAVENNQVKLLPIERIMKKWDKKPLETTKISKSNSAQDILNKF